jgi:hypothetical protein
MASLAVPLDAGPRNDSRPQILPLTDWFQSAAKFMQCILASECREATLRCTERKFYRQAAQKTIDPETVSCTFASTQEGGRQMIPATIRLRQNFPFFDLQRPATIDLAIFFILKTPQAKASVFGVLSILI